MPLGAEHSHAQNRNVELVSSVVSTTARELKPEMKPASCMLDVMVVKPTWRRLVPRREHIVIVIMRDRLTVG